MAIDISCIVEIDPPCVLPGHEMTKGQARKRFDWYVSEYEDHTESNIRDGLGIEPVAANVRDVSEAVYRTMATNGRFAPLPDHIYEEFRARLSIRFAEY